jgi:predicted DNA-binding transcriptional regulator YafY
MYEWLPPKTGSSLLPMRTARLLSLLQALRRRRGPVSAQLLADELGTSLRTLYRDVATLREQGAGIEGEAGVGYVLRPSFFLPPLMLSQAETEALMLGMRWVSTFADRPLAQAALDAQAKIEAVLPKSVREGAGDVALRVGPSPCRTEDLSLLRDAIRHERKLAIVYQDVDGKRGSRTVWPFAIGYFPNGRILVGWCEARQDYRHFRTDGLLKITPLDERYPRRRRTMFHEWHRQQLEKEGAVVDRRARRSMELGGPARPRK